MSEVPNTLKMVADIVGKATPVLPLPLQVAGGLVEMVLRAGAAIAQAGKDPIVEIHRILNADPEVKAVHNEWQEMLDKKFGRGDESTPVDNSKHPDFYSELDGGDEG